MNLEFRKITSGPFAGATFVTTKPAADRPDEEERLRAYLAEGLAKANKPITYRACNTYSEMAQAIREGVDFPYLSGKAAPFFDRDSILGALQRATEQAEANGGWGIADQGPFNEPETTMDARFAEQTTPAPNPEDVQPFEIADVVRLVSGGPRLTVTDCFRCSLCGGWHVDVCWHDANGVFHEVDGLDAALFAMVTV